MTSVSPEKMLRDVAAALHRRFDAISKVYDFYAVMRGKVCCLCVCGV